MAQFNDVNEVVEEGARIFESVEADLKQLHKRIEKLVPVIEAGNRFALYGALAKGAYSGAALEAAGKIGTALRVLYELHAKLTKHCQDAGVDIPTTQDGGR